MHMMWFLGIEILVANTGIRFSDIDFNLSGVMLGWEVRKLHTLSFIFTFLVV